MDIDKWFMREWYKNCPVEIAGLVSTLPEKWTIEQRGKFMKTFEAVLEYAVPITNGDEQCK